MSRRFVVQQPVGAVSRPSHVSDVRVTAGPALLDSLEHPHNSMHEGSTISNEYDSDSNSHEEQLMPPQESPGPRPPGRKRAHDDPSHDADESLAESRTRVRTGFVEKDADPYVTAEQVRYSMEERGKSLAAMQLRSAPLDREFQEQLRAVRAKTEQEVRRSLEAKHSQQLAQLNDCLRNLDLQFKKMHECNQRIRQEAERRIQEVVAKHQERDSAMDAVISWLLMKLRLEQYQLHITREEAAKQVTRLSAVVTNDVPLAQKTIDDYKRQIESLKQQLSAARAQPEGPADALKMVVLEEAEAEAVPLPPIVRFQADEIQEQAKHYLQQYASRTAKSPNPQVFKSLMGPLGQHQHQHSAPSDPAAAADVEAIKDEPVIDVEAEFSQFTAWQEMNSVEQAHQLETLQVFQQELECKDIQIEGLQEELDFYRTMVHHTIGEIVPPSDFPPTDESLSSLLLSPDPRYPPPVAQTQTPTSGLPTPSAASSSSAEMPAPAAPAGRDPLREAVYEASDTLPPRVSPLATSRYLPMSPLQIGLFGFTSPLAKPAGGPLGSSPAGAAPGNVPGFSPARPRNPTHMTAMQSANATVNAQSNIKRQRPARPGKR